MIGGRLNQSPWIRQEICRGATIHTLVRSRDKPDPVWPADRPERKLSETCGVGTLRRDSVEATLAKVPNKMAFSTQPAYGRSVTAQLCALAALVSGALAACASSESRAGSTGAYQGPDRTEVVATIDRNPVTMADLLDRIGDELAEIDLRYRRSRYELLEAALEGIIVNRLLEEEAAARGITLEDLIAAETLGKIEVTEGDVAEWYRRNQARLGSRSLEELSPQIEEALRGFERNRILTALAKQIQEQREVVYLLEPVRLDVSVEDSPALGADDARVTLVEFSDFECPFCGGFFHTLKQLRQNYADRVRIVYRQYPLVDIHPHAFKAAEASLCADDQGRFWAMHDLLFGEQDELDVAALKEKARRLGLDHAKFDACLDSGEKAEQIERDVRDGDRLGVEGTPAIFVNGIPVPGGAVPYEIVSELIERELRRTRSD